MTTSRPHSARDHKASKRLEPSIAVAGTIAPEDLGDDTSVSRSERLQPMIEDHRGPISSAHRIATGCAEYKQTDTSLERQLLDGSSQLAADCPDSRCGTGGRQRAS